jgi:predicted RNA binding protein YcfA (HicA-like mRNA interferase family)
MGSKYPVLPPEKIISVLRIFGFNKISQKGSHAKYRKDGEINRTVIIPMHDEVAKGTLQSILEQANITLEEFKKYL